MHRRTILAAATALAATALAGCGGGNDDPVATAPLTGGATRNIVQLAQATSELSTLVQAVSAAGLVDTLQEPGPFTVFAPTNGAFEALLAELGITLDELLADQGLLTAVLTYHVLPARVERADVPLGRAIATVQGDVFKVEDAAGTLTITDGRNRTSRITATDIQASNGVVHLVDRVLLPPDRNIVETAQALPQFSTLVEAVVAANLQGTLSGTGPFTVLAPTNDAFDALFAELNVTKEALFGNTALLTSVLTYHVIPSRVLRAEIPTDTDIATAQGGSLRISPQLVVTDQRGRTANLVVTDVLASNGVVHAVDRVILPRP